MSSTAPTVYLFDIDGTLISTAGAGRRAFAKTFEEWVGPGEYLDFSFAGMTDRGIARQGLEAAGKPATEETMDQVLDTYAELLGEFVEESADFTIFSGVFELLDKLSARPSSAIGLGTGNIERGARIKLSRGGLNAYFEFGGFGCDAEERAALIEIGARRGAERLKEPLEACRVVVIGDTPRDVAAARAIDAECVAVATGGHGIDVLESCGAHYAFADLTAPQIADLLVG